MAKTANTDRQRWVGNDPGPKNKTKTTHWGVKYARWGCARP